MAAKGRSNSQCDQSEGLKKYVSRTPRWAGQVASMGDSSVLVGSTDRRRRLDREVGWEGIDWCDLAQDRDRWWALVNAVTNLWIL
jgi:hypothetical protein